MTSDIPSKSIWIKNGIDYSVLNDQKIDYKIAQLPKPNIGTGKLSVRKNPDGEFSVEIRVDRKIDDGRFEMDRIFLGIEWLKRIKMDNNPNAEIAYFLLVD